MYALPPNDLPNTQCQTFFTFVSFYYSAFTIQPAACLPMYFSFP